MWSSSSSLLLLLLLLEFRIQVNAFFLFFFYLCAYGLTIVVFVNIIRDDLSLVGFFFILLPIGISISVHSSRNKSCTILKIFFLYFVIATTHTIGSVSCVKWLEIQRYIACKKISTQFLSLSLSYIRIAFPTICCGHPSTLINTNTLTTTTTTIIIMKLVYSLISSHI